MKNKQTIQRVYMWILITVVVGWMVYIFSIIHDRFDTDLLWHIKIGEDILSKKEIFLENTYSWLNGTIWTQHEWLFDVILYCIVSLFGIAGFAFIHFASQFCYIYVNIIRKQHHFPLFLIVIVLLMYIYFPFASLNRPIEYSSMLMVLMIFLYDKMFKLKPIVYFLIGLFIANFHCGAAVSMAALMILIFVLDVIIAKLYKCFDDKYEMLSNKFILQYVFCIMAYMIGLCINPYGYKQVINMFCVMDLSSTKYIEEWKSFTSGHYAAWILIFVIAYSFGYGLKKDFNRNTIREIGILSAFLVLSCVSSKAFVIFYYIYLAYGIKYIDNMIFDIGTNIGFTINWFSQKLEYDISGFSRKKNIMSLIILVFAILFATCSFVYSNENMSEFMRSSKTEYVDDGAISCLKDVSKYNDNIRILNGYTSGNYLLYNNVKCFIDTRQQPYAKEFGWTSALDDYFETKPYDTEAMNIFFEKYDFNYVLSNEECNLDWYLSQCCDDWIIIYTNNDETIKIWERIKY